MDDDEIAGARKKVVHTIGEPLDTLSIDELEERILALKAEAERLQQAIADKRKTADAAASLFRKG